MPIRLLPLGQTSPLPQRLVPTKRPEGWLPPIPNIVVSRVRTPGHWGMAYLDDWWNGVKGHIHIDPDLDDATTMEIAVHELNHIFWPQLDEGPVELHARTTRDLLTKLGFHR